MMIQLDYENPLHAQPPRRRWPRWPYFWGGISVTMAGLLVGIILLSIWPRGRLEILQSPEMMMCAPITLAVILMHISTMIYTLIASPLQTTGRHFLHGVIAGLFLMASAIFAERSAAAKLRQSDLIGELCLATFLITPVVLGLLSRHDATK